MKLLDKNSKDNLFLLLYGILERKSSPKSDIDLDFYVLYDYHRNICSIFGVAVEKEEEWVEN